MRPPGPTWWASEVSGRLLEQHQQLAVDADGRPELVDLGEAVESPRLEDRDRAAAVEATGTRKLPAGRTRSSLTPQVTIWRPP